MILGTPNIHVTSRKRHLEITQTMLEDLLYDPVKGVWVFFRMKLDVFQQCRLIGMWFGSDIEDSSGVTTGKSLGDFLFLNLSAVMMWDLRCVAIYQTFQGAKDNFWDYYDTPLAQTPLFRYQIGRLDMEGKADGKGTSKGASCYKVFFKNRSQIWLPAPDFLKESKTMAGRRFNRMVIDEANKIVETKSGEVGVNKQLLGRVTRSCYNENHPVWCNKIVYTSTAELQTHPAYARHAQMEREVNKGNPDFVVQSWCFKDYSNLKCSTGKTFREEYGSNKRLKTMMASNTPEQVLAEVFGIWAKSAKAWYTIHMILAARELGRMRGVRPILSRADDPLGEKAIYTLGGDTAPSWGQRSDRGALDVLRAVPRVENPGNLETDYQTDLVYARSVRNLDIEGWSGLVHELDQAFGFSCMLFDHGGGGQWIAPHMAKPRQLIRGVETEVMPIVMRHASALEGRYLLNLFYRGEDGLRRLWPALKHARGDDVLRDYANTYFRLAWSKRFIGLPPAYGDYPQAELAKWEEERRWAAKMLTVMTQQMLKVTTATNPDGTWKLSGHGAKIFGCQGKDDQHDGGRNAYIAFLIWLQDNDAGWNLNPDDAALGDGG